VKAEDKGKGKSEKITITNEKGWLSLKMINRMVWEAKVFDARNSLETYVYYMNNQINDKDKHADMLESDEKDEIESAITVALEWLDDNQNAEKEDYEEKLKEMEAVCNTIVNAVYVRKEDEDIYRLWQ
jgi:heat shock protein 5